MEREWPLELAHGLFVGDLEEVRCDCPRAAVAHEVVERGADLHRVLRVAARGVEKAVDARVVDREPLRREFRPQILQPIIRIDAEAVAAGIGEIERDREAIEGVAFFAEELFEYSLLRAEERVAHPALGLEARAHDVEDSRPETTRRLELVEDHDDSLARPFCKGVRQVESALDVLVFDLHRGVHPRSDRLGLLEAPFDAGEVLQGRVGEALAEAANVRRAEAVDVAGVGTTTL